MSLQRAIRLGMAGTAVLALGVGVLGYYALERRRAATAPVDGVTVAVGPQRCDPDRLAVEAGWNTFNIRNESERVVEWEILDGVMVVEERENIAPGMTQRLRAKLAPGRYSITCGLIGNPRGELVVRPAAVAEAVSPGADPVALIGPAAEYKVFLLLNVETLDEAVEALSRAVSQAGLAAGEEGGEERAAASPAGEAGAWRRTASEALDEARGAYGRAAPVLRALFSDLDARINGQASDYPAGAEDPGFTGLRRLTLMLRGGATAGSLRPRVATLAVDVATLRARLDGFAVPPDRMLAATIRWLRDMADRLAPEVLPGVERPDRAEIGAGIEGARKVAALLGPLAPSVPALDGAMGALRPAEDGAVSPVALRAAATALQSLAVALKLEEATP